MSTSVNTNTAATGATNISVATETVGSDQVQRLKLMTGASGVDGGDVTTGNPFPVVDAGTATGNASLATIATNTTGASTAVNQSTANTSLASIDGKTPSGITVTAASTAAATTDRGVVVSLSPNGQPSNGQNTVAGSRTVNSASDDVNLGPCIFVAGVSLTGAGDFLAETDTSAYVGMYVHITGSGTGMNVGITGGNVSGGLVSVPGQSVGQETSFGPASNITSNQLVFVPLGFRYSRVALVAIGSGTVTVTITFLKRAVVVPSFPQQISPISVVTIGPANTARGQNSAASTSAANLKSAAAILNAGTVMNTGAAVRYVHFYNKASAPVPGTDTPAFSIPLGAAMVTPYAIPCGAFGRRFSNGIGIAITTDFAATAGATVTAAGEVTFDISW